MNLKTLVWLFLMSFVIVLGNIILFGIGGKENFIIYYALFALVCVFIIIYSMRNFLENKSEYVVLIVLGLLFVFSVSFCANSFKFNLDTSKELLNYKGQILQEDAVLEQKNQYYISYINYTRGVISLYQNQSNIIQSKISNIMLSYNNSRIVVEEVIVYEPEVPVVPVQPVVVPPPIYYEDDDERDGGERDDD
jgi:hypothetical protein